MANEFWRELKPVAEVFRPGAQPEAYIANAATDDDRYYAPLSPTAGSRPLWICQARRTLVACESDEPMRVT
jgi:2,4'-dihydroxyacetophenone dioxygenase